MYEFESEEFATIGFPYRMQEGGEIFFPTVFNWHLTENALRLERNYSIRITHGAEI